MTKSRYQRLSECHMLCLPKSVVSPFKFIIPCSLDCDHMSLLTQPPESCIGWAFVHRQGLKIAVTLPAAWKFQVHSSTGDATRDLVRGVLGKPTFKVEHLEEGLGEWCRPSFSVRRICLRIFFIGLILLSFFRPGIPAHGIFRTKLTTRECCCMLFHAVAMVRSFAKHTVTSGI